MKSFSQQYPEIKLINCKVIYDGDNYTVMPDHPEQATTKEYKEILEREIKKRGLDSVLNEVAAILASGVNQRTKIKELMEGR